MSLEKTLEENLITAIKNKEELAVSVLRLIKSDIKNVEIAKGRGLSEVEVTDIVLKQAKQRRDSIMQYLQGNRKDLAEKEQAELGIIETYLPKEITEAELTKLIEQVILETHAESISQLGQVIKAVMVKTKGQADGKTISEIVKTKLA